MNAMLARLRSRYRRPVAKDDSLQPMDLILSGISSAVAVYAAAESLASDSNARFFVLLVIVGSLVSLGSVWFAGKSRLMLADATLYTGLALLAAFGISSLNSLTPDPIYTTALTMAGVLSWMLVLGSFVVWRDQTMLFQAVPAVALFGLVGCYDTFAPAVAYFFVFLIAQAILLSRAHGRSMLRQARLSGSSNLVERSSWEPPLEVSEMRRGPWRWMAGPEWALASALVIVLVSLIGAPILRESARGFSGIVRFTPPMAHYPGFRNRASLSSAGDPVGTGPSSLTDAPVLRVTMPEPMYLHQVYYGRYEHGKWFLPDRTASIMNPGDPDLNPGLGDIAVPRELPFRVEPLLANASLVPVPGEVVRVITGSGLAYNRNYAGSFTVHGDAPYPPLEGTAIVDGGSRDSRESDRSIIRKVPEYGATEDVPSDVAEFARQVTRKAKTDEEKADAIQHAIEITARYNLKARATPQDQDPVSFFLFQSKEGYCDLFASAMTLMARSVGLPARYVTGYYPFDSHKDEEGRYIVEAKDAHAWCEILFKDKGWVVFDATSGAEQVDGGARGETNQDSLWNSSLFVGIASLFGIGGLLYGVWRLRRWILANYSPTTRPARRAQRDKVRLESRLRKAYLAFERDVRKVNKRPRGVGESLEHYVGTASSKLGPRAALGLETAMLFSRLFYGATPLSAATVEGAFRQVRRFAKSPRRDPT